MSSRYLAKQKKEKKAHQVNKNTLEKIRKSQQQVEFKSCWKTSSASQIQCGHPSSEHNTSEKGIAGFKMLAFAALLAVHAGLAGEYLLVERGISKLNLTK